MSEKITSQEVVEALKDIHQPDFIAWARYAFSVGQLEILVQTIIGCKKATNNVEAIKYLANYTNGDSNKKNGKVTWGDMTRTSSSRKLFNKLNELVTEKGRSVTYDRSRYYGVVSHVALPKLLSGELINIDQEKRKKNSAGRQMSFFEETPKVQKLFQKASKGSAIKLLDTIARQWDILRKQMRFDFLPIHHQFYKKLCKNLEKIYGAHVGDILTHGVLNEEHFAFKTMMIWASGLSYYRTVGNLLFFRELWVLPNNCDIGAGRLDALIVSKINHQVPTLRQTSIILQIILSEKFSSVGHVITRLVQLFPDSYFEFEIADWKFAVGDGVKGIYQQVNIIEADEVREHPFPEHERQIKRYLSLTMLSYRLASKRPGDFWNSKSFQLKGKIVYLLPDNTPITHEVQLTAEELKSVFVEQVANNFRSGKQQRLLVFYSNRYLNHAIKLLTNGADDEERFEKKSLLSVQQSTFVGMLSPEQARQTSTLKIEPLIEEHRTHVYKGEYSIVEIVGRNNKEERDIYKMHYNRLIEQIELGNLKASKEFLQKGYKGHVTCPVHGEKTPSMAINFSKDLFKCFGCGISGGFFPESIPDDMQLGLRSDRFVKKETKEIRKLAIPVRHQEIMKLAQRSLQRGFLDSPGASYLEKERKLYPELSLQDGAGYGSLRFVEELLDEGVSYEEFLWYGFFGISQHVKQNDPLIQLLMRYYPISKLVQEVPTSKKTLEKPLYGLPYSILEGRVTYPLEIAGIVNTFYGRSIDANCPKAFRHRKLIVDNTNIPHGAYRMHAAMQKQVLKTNAKIVVVESPINADTLRVMCNDNPSSTAIIGVNNDILFEVLAGFEGDIVVAFDNDPAQLDETGNQLFNGDGTPKGMTGQKNTLLFAEKVRSYGFKGHVLDFTAAFVRANSQRWNFSDINQFWVDYRERINLFDYVQSVRVGN